jgi:predicted RecA/RadA family phage recombinase
MAKNRVLGQSNKRISNVGVTASSVSGAPMVVGQLPCVLLTNADSGNKAIVQLDGVWTMLVNGVDQSGNSAVAVGDILYYTAGDTIKLSKKNTGIRWGYALGTVPSGNSTTSIPAQVGY